MKQILTHDLNEHYDGIPNKTSRINFIKYQIELLNSEGHNLGIVFRFKKDQWLQESEQEEFDYYDFYNKTHDFEVDLKDVDEDELELIESYGVYSNEHDYYEAKKASDKIDPVVTGLLYKPIGSFIDECRRMDLLTWMGNHYNNFQMYASKFYNISENIYKKFDEPEWCIHIRTTDKRDGNILPIPTFVMCEEIEKRNIHKSPFLLMTDSDVVMDEMRKKYENIRYFEDHYRSEDGVIPLHILHQLRKFYYNTTLTKTELWEQIIIEVLTSIQCKKILFNIMTSTVHMWHHLAHIGKKEPFKVLYDEVKDKKYPLSEMNNYYASTTEVHYGFHHDFDTYLLNNFHK